MRVGDSPYWVEGTAVWGVDGKRNECPTSDRAELWARRLNAAYTLGELAERERAKAASLEQAVRDVGAAARELKGDL